MTFTKPCQNIVAANFCLLTKEVSISSLSARTLRVSETQGLDELDRTPSEHRAHSPAHPKAHDAPEGTSIVVKKDVQGRCSVRPRRGRVISA